MPKLNLRWEAAQRSMLKEGVPPPRSKSQIWRHQIPCQIINRGKVTENFCIHQQIGCLVSLRSLITVSGELHYHLFIYWIKPAKDVLNMSQGSHSKVSSWCLSWLVQRPDSMEMIACQVKRSKKEKAILRIFLFDNHNIAAHCCSWMPWHLKIKIFPGLGLHGCRFCHKTSVTQVHTWMSFLHWL